MWRCASWKYFSPLNHLYKIVQLCGWYILIFSLPLGFNLYLARMPYKSSLQARVKSCKLQQVLCWISQSVRFANTLTHSLFIIKTFRFGAIRLQTATKIFNQLHNRPNNWKKWCQSREFIVSLSRVQDVVCVVCLIGTNPWWERKRERKGKENEGESKKRVYDSDVAHRTSHSRMRSVLS